MTHVLHCTKPIFLKVARGSILRDKGPPAPSQSQKRSKVRVDLGQCERGLGGGNFPRLLAFAGFIANVGNDIPDFVS
jgi:hypothetical protein